MSLVAREIPLMPGTAQQFSITLAGVAYQLVVKWCDPAACWLLDILDQTGTAILLGVPLVTGANLLEQYQYLGIGGALVVQTDHDTNAVPTFDNLGVLGHLYYLSS